ncbi:predicted protein [Naegleria gruberi]|uniref:Predicted protein n=1 Tax=Naegleria gruberi TaxID=5762 RepID=D2VK42_NAEGR|nr:uncharacterized protein NAEGRDRAFT_58449 [Naegleria gruberi]EFC42797.1 predicted protein [Naegleria gruberi]|eukprot:XP_002675541.1 predicted protein [Naegleria gruberi strain NEG-M]
MKTRNTQKLLLSVVGNNGKCCYSTTNSNLSLNALRQHLSNQQQSMEKAKVSYNEKVVNNAVNLYEDRKGDEAKHNWSLSKGLIFPQYDAYRNADNETLLKKSFGQVDSEKQFLKVKEIASTEYDKYVAHADKTTPLVTYTAKDEKFHKRSQREVGWYLSYAPNSFTQDGCFGSANQNTCLVRVVTDNSVSGLFLKNMILPTRKLDSSVFKYDSLVLHTPGFQFVPTHVVQEFGGPLPKDLGLTKEQFVFENDQTNSSVVSGVFNQNVLLDNLAFFGARTIFTKSGGAAIVLPSDSFINSDKSSTTLIINSNNITRTALTASNITLYGAHYNVLSELGLSRGVGGVLVEVDVNSELAKSLKKGDLVEESADGKTVKISTKVSSTVLPNIAHTPKNIVFVVEDANFIVPVLGKVKNAQQFFQSGLVSVGKDATFNKSFTTFGAQRAYADAKQVAESFAKLNKAANVYIVNGSYDATKIQQALSLISSGEAASLKEDLSNSLFSTLSHKSLENKAWKDQSKYAAAIKQLEENVSKSL